MCVIMHGSSSWPLPFALYVCPRYARDKARLGAAAASTYLSARRHAEHGIFRERFQHFKLKSGSTVQVEIWCEIFCDHCTSYFPPRAQGRSLVIAFFATTRIILVRLYARTSPYSSTLYYENPSHFGGGSPISLSTFTRSEISPEFRICALLWNESSL